MRGSPLEKQSKSTEKSLIFPGLRPKRTLRLVLWTAEEQGGIGASQYYQFHKVKTSHGLLNICTYHINISRKDRIYFGLKLPI
jgi:Zn-dependent M28 family amino/carboxypeptidase